MRFHGLGGSHPQLQMLLTWRPLSCILWPSRKVGRPLRSLQLPALGPSLGFAPAPALSHSDSLYLHDVLLGAGD